MTDTILNLITWLNATAVSLCDYVGISPAAAVVIVALAALIAHFAV